MPNPPEGFNIQDECNAYLKECFEDGEPANEMPFCLAMYLKALARRMNSGLIYQYSQDSKFIEKTIKESGIKFRQK